MPYLPFFKKNFNRIEGTKKWDGVEDECVSERSREKKRHENTIFIHLEKRWVARDWCDEGGKECCWEKQRSFEKKRRGILI